jgi:Fe2+ transport system protein FeoA
LIGPSPGSAAQRADRAGLDAYLSYPAVNPQGEPIPRSEGILSTCIAVPASKLDAGEPARITLDAQGIRPGARVHLLAASEQSVLMQVDDQHISLARALADKVFVEPIEEGRSGERTLQPLLEPDPHSNSNLWR